MVVCIDDEYCRSFTEMADFGSDSAFYSIDYYSLNYMYY